MPSPSRWCKRLFPAFRSQRPRSRGRQAGLRRIRGPADCPRPEGRRSPAEAPAWSRRARPPRPPCRSREQEGDGRPLTALRRDLRPAAGLRREAVDLGQPEAGALAHLLGREEGLERALDHFRRHARARVADGKRDEVRAIFLHRPRGQGERTAVRHCVARIDRGVEDGGFELRGVDFHAASRWRKIELDLDAAAERPGEHFGQGVEADVEVEHLRLDRLAPPEREQMVGQGGRAIGGFGDRFEILLALFASGRSGLRSRKSAEPATTVIRLLKSCAMPPVSSPSA